MAAICRPRREASGETKPAHTLNLHNYRRLVSAIGTAQPLDLSGSPANEHSRPSSLSYCGAESASLRPSDREEDARLGTHSFKPGPSIRNTLCFPSCCSRLVTVQIPRGQAFRLPSTLPQPYRCPRGQVLAGPGPSSEAGFLGE